MLFRIEIHIVLRNLKTKFFDQNRKSEIFKENFKYKE